MPIIKTILRLLQRVIKPHNTAKSNSYYTGINAENIACKYLKHSGYKIIKLNYKTKVGEIDIIALKQDVLHAIEVKFRSNNQILPYSINQKQRFRVKQAFEMFLKTNKVYQNHKLQITAILINSNKEINIINNAW